VNKTFYLSLKHYSNCKHPVFSRSYCELEKY